MAIYDNHIVMLSDQNAAELLAALAPSCGCRHLHALITPKMLAQTPVFERVCKRKGLQFSPFYLSSAEPDEIRSVLEQIWLKSPNESFCVNITGGTKLMAIAAFQWAFGNYFPILYVDTQEAKIKLFEKGEWRGQEIPQLLDVETLLNLYGNDIDLEKPKPLSGRTRQALESLSALGENRTLETLSIN